MLTVLVFLLLINGFLIYEGLLDGCLEIAASYLFVILLAYFLVLVMDY